MDFYDILDQVIDILRSRGRMSYRALKRQFDLDDDYMEDLKEELIYSQRLAVDEGGRVLVWIGASATKPAPASTPPTEHTVTQEIGLTPVEPLPPVPSPPDAERRQLTVMFCDLVDSTRLSSQLDPEEYRDVVRAYQRVCTEVIQRYEGHIAQLLGDGLLVYFGYPVAHEDDAQRAIRAGLDMLAALGDLNQDLQHAKGLQLALRVGMHTGLVVVGEMGGVGRQERLALGEVPNIASRIEGLAEANTVAISDATSRLVQGYFEYQALGAQTLRGVAKPVRLYRVHQESGARGRLDIAVTRGLTPLVGREAEVTLLRERWEQAKSGQGHVVLLTGDAGIGKSRLVQMLKDHIANDPHVRWECRSVEYYQNTALFPLADLFQRLLRFEAHETPDAKFGKLEQMLRQYRLPLEESVQLFAPLLSLPIPEDTYPPLQLSPQRQRQKVLETLVAILQEHAEREPVLFILEDLHWTDPTTLELLGLLLDQTPTASLLVLLTCRPHFQPSWHHRSYITEMTLNHLAHPQVEQIVTGMTDGKAFPAEVLAQIIEKTDGVPLFVEEMTKALLESGHLKAVDGHYELTGSFATLAIPATLQDSLMARLDRLVTAKAVAQYAAVIGRQFPYELLQAVSQLDKVTLQRELGRLVEAEIVYQRGVPPYATYTFKHALIQDAAYESLLKSTRQHYHQQLAQVLEAQFPETGETQPELLAHHYTEAGLAEQAVGYWQRASERSTAQSAYVEAVTHLSKGLEVLQTLPDTSVRVRHELDMRVALGQALAVTKGPSAPEVGHAYTRAWELCRQVGDTPQLASVLVGLCTFYRLGGELRAAREFGEQLLTLAQHLHDPERLAYAYWMLGEVMLYLGEFVPARAHLEQAFIVSAASQDRSLFSGTARVTALGTLTWVLWLLGYPDQALRQSYKMLTYAQELRHIYSLARALFNVAVVHKWRREVDATQERARAARAIITEQGFLQLLGSITFTQGWALTAQGQHEKGIAEMRQGLATMRTIGRRQVEYLARLGEAYGRSGQAEEGLRLLAEALTLIDTIGERWYEAELHRIKGALLLQQAVPDTPQAEARFRQALNVARRQEAKSLELRAAMSLSRLWQQQEKRQEAYDLLAPVYGWFTEGFDTADLQEAQALLDALAEGGSHDV
jgi:class 3 adenylate cyclase/predicted ATPase